MACTRGLGVFAFVSFVTGCTGGGDGGGGSSPNVDACGESADPTACWTARYFGGAQPSRLPACEGAPAPTPINGRREVSFFMGPTVADAEVREQGAFLQGFYNKYALTFFTHGESQNAGFNYALGGSEEDFQAVVD